MPYGKITRRTFVVRSSKAALAVLTAPLLCRPSLFGGELADKRLNIACIGLGNQMQGLITEIKTAGQNIVALCDVDAQRISTTQKSFGDFLSGAKFYRDYRELLKREKSLNAVVVATPDHWHASICTAAIQAEKHVYCEKPLTHSVAETRQLRALAKKSKVVTQTGNQGAASPNFRRSMELIQAGAIGPVGEIHIWHPPHGWPCGVDRPTGEDPIPEGLDWDFWLGPAPLRPYKNGQYHQINWRGWYDFGGGSLADFCCHSFSLPVRALNLDYPNEIKVSGTPLGKESFPTNCKLQFKFPARAGRGHVSIYFYTGGEKPPANVTAGMEETFGEVPRTGCMLQGGLGTLSAGLWNNECYLKLNGEQKFRDGTKHEAGKNIPKSLPRAPQGRHVLEWIEACQGGPKTFSPFEIGGHVTEIGAAGIVALRLGRDIEWDGKAMRVSGVPEADALVKPVYRKGWV
ncbi:MAG: Gfo/Idh/MocA family oxidoreductase [Verrucomicrobiota bacterium]